MNGHNTMTEITIFCPNFHAVFAQSVEAKNDLNLDFCFKMLYETLISY